MEGSHLSSQHQKEQECNLKEWHLQAGISRENTSSRRYSASYIRSFREDSRTPFKANVTISSTKSSPGYILKDEIDPSTYSFTTALKALQAKSEYVWECYSSPEGLALNSKWDEAERYICNPLSGEVPVECLSSKTLSTPSFRNNMASRVTMSAPLVYSIYPRRTSTSTTTTNKAPPTSVVKEQLVKLPSFRQEEKKMMGTTRDVGVQITSPANDSSSSPSPASTPSIKERTINRFEESQETEDGDTQNSSNSVNLIPVEQVEVKVTREGEETKRRTKESKEKKENKTCKCRPIKGCLQLSSWSSLLWMNNKRKERKIHAPNN